MGCGVSNSKKVTKPPPLQLLTANEHQAPKDVTVESSSQDEVHAALTELKLEQFVPSLQKMGVACLRDVNDLLVADLEEIGLNRVQIRQLQRYAAETLDAPTGGTGREDIGSSQMKVHRDTYEKSEPAACEDPLPQVTVVKATVRGHHETKDDTMTLLDKDKQTVLVQTDKKDFKSLPHVQSLATGKGTRACMREPSPDCTSCANSEGQQCHGAEQKGEEKLEPSRQEAPTIVKLRPDQMPQDTDSECLTLQKNHQVYKSSPFEEDNQTLAQPHHMPQPNHDSDFDSNQVDDYDSDASDLLHEDDEGEELLDHTNVPCETQQESFDMLNALRGRIPHEDTPLIGQQMPEALRKRLERRAEQRNVRRQQGSGVEVPAFNGKSRETAAARSKPVRTPPRPTSPRRSASVGNGAVAQNAARGRAVRSRSIHNQNAADAEEAGGRQMFDKITLRLRSRDLFCTAIRRYREKVLHMNLDEEEPAMEDPASCTLRPNGNPIQVFMRKRPLFEKDMHQNGDFDAISVVPSQSIQSKVVLHSCQFEADLKRPFINHTYFEFDHVFGQCADNEQVYRIAASEMVGRARHGGIGTMFMLGQTGSGKTHTMTAIEHAAARDLFLRVSEEVPVISMQFVELRGNKCFDLLAPGPKDARPEVRLREHSSGSFALDGTVLLSPKSPEELCRMMHEAHGRRATASTDANSVSSRSHAVCLLRHEHSQGQLMLVDCAGSERRKDSMFHSKERQQEGADINASLHALKECIRNLAKNQQVAPHLYRASSLTKLLAEAFSRGNEARLAVICTASPCASDSEHTLTTLRAGMALAGRGAEVEKKEPLVDLLREQRGPRETHPKQWSPEQVKVWLQAAKNGLFNDVADKLPTNFTGQMLVRLTEARCVQLCNSDNNRGHKLFDALHKEIQRIDHQRKQQS